MRSFEISDRYTTADIGLELAADSLEELFIAASEGMFAVILGGRSEEKSTVKKRLEFSTDSLETLLVDWLSELIYLFDTDGLIPERFHLTITTEEERPTVSGDVDFRRYDRERDQAEHEIKAVTYYKLNIRKDDGLYRCHVVFDL